ncbi:hypothetical protein LEP1GSC133_4282 [Leptospira borgpetersenii serovar Pomona str. 200901868]|uniref:Uncharacterized protein n=1 Tax=Leptospira borgpetersenii serovar Pomona str. 200901868 TaxID=1192866 RepID=M6VZD3_LEPBO|nr:hypothetical protein LEP1GSC133_4282 [Leptospira borgpetersenii serovar Pomona str. 200901868]
MGNRTKNSRSEGFTTIQGDCVSLGACKKAKYSKIIIDYLILLHGT